MLGLRGPGLHSKRRGVRCDLPRTSLYNRPMSSWVASIVILVLFASSRFPLASCCFCRHSESGASPALEFHGLTIGEFG